MQFGVLIQRVKIETVVIWLTLLAQPVWAVSPTIYNVRASHWSGTGRGTRETDCGAGVQNPRRNKETSASRGERRQDCF